ncbi:MAG: acyltransferase family protein [Gallionellaceae bacterium]
MVTSHIQTTKKDYGPMPEAGHLPHPKYRADIDGLRAIAVLSVVGYHAFPYWVKGGFIGVDIFFVISGFLISTIIFGGLETNRFSFQEFYSRRIKRIFPALLVVLICCIAFGWFALLADEYKQLGKHIAAGAGFVSNMVLWNESGYFDNSAETKPLLHLWSLGIEEQFYIIWPMLLWLAWRKKFNFLLITSAIAAITFTLNIINIGSDPISTFYLPQTRFWELLIGSCLAYVVLYKQGILQRFKSTNGNLQSFLGSLLLIVGILFINNEREFPGWWALLPTLGAASIILAGSQAFLNRVILSNRVLVWFGLISFPLYLWHWPLLAFARIVESGNPSKEIRLVCVAMAIALAWITFKFIEKPIRFSKHNFFVTTSLFILMTISGVTGYFIYAFGGLEFRDPNRNAASISYANGDIAKQIVGHYWQYTSNSICRGKYDFPNARFCIQSKPTPPTVILLGTSFANHLYAGFIKNDRLNHHSVLSIGTCSPEDVSESDCMAQDKIIRNSPSIQYAILSNTWPDISEPGVKWNRFIEGLDKRIEFLESRGIKVIIFGPKPEINYDIRGCFSRPFKISANESCIVTMKDVALQQKNIVSILRKVLERHPRVAYFDQNSIFCNTNQCSVIKNGMPLLRDNSHYSEYGSNQIIMSFSDWAEKNLPDIFH